jgi:hypothetical protein
VKRKAKQKGKPWLALHHHGGTLAG